VYDAAARSYTLTLTQSCAPTPGQAVKEPFVIPVALGLLGANGTEQPRQLAHWNQPEPGSRTFVLTEASESFTFVNVDSSRSLHPARFLGASGAGFRLQR
jgi:aminopeptidase N